MEQDKWENKRIFRLILNFFIEFLYFIIEICFFPKFEFYLVVGEKGVRIVVQS